MYFEVINGSYISFSDYIEIINSNETYMGRVYLTTVSMPNYMINGKLPSGGQVTGMVNDHTITTNSFNIDDVEVTNGEKEYKNNTLYIKINGQTVEEYNVIETGSSTTSSTTSKKSTSKTSTNTKSTTKQTTKKDSSTKNNGTNNESSSSENNVESTNVNNVINNDNRNTSISSKTTLTKITKNTKTYDGIVKYFVLCIISAALIAGILIYTKKEK